MLSSGFKVLHLMRKKGSYRVCIDQPKDVSIKLDEPKPKMFDKKRPGLNALIGVGDGGMLFVNNDMHTAKLKSLLTARGGEIVNPSD